MKKIFTIVFLVFISSLLVSGQTFAKGNGKGGRIAAEQSVASESSDSSDSDDALDYNDATHLTFMREEEKLARDVYNTFHEMYPNSRAFGQIEDSEQKHTDAVAAMLARYGLEDPNTNDAIGKYTGEEYGPYFTEKYELLVEMGRKSLLDAMYVGALIEELDMHDLIYCPQAIVEADNGVDVNECGQIYTDEEPILELYQKLLNGSASHLRGYVQNIESVIGEGNYEAQVLTQEEVDGILGR